MTDFTLPGISIVDAVGRLAALGAQTVVIAGDSITQQMGYTDNVITQFDISYAVWANALMGGRFTFVNNAGVGSTKSAEMLATLDEKVIAYTPDWCWMLIGANDANASVGTSAEIIAAFKANVTAAIEKCRAAGIRVMIGTIMPTLSGNSAWTTERVYRVFTMNSWIRSLPSAYPGLVVADFASAVVDPTSASAQPRAGYLQADDGIHPGHKGAYYMGLVVKDALEGITPKVPRLVSSVADAYDYLGYGDQLLKYPLFSLATGGVNSTSGTITGDIPSSMSLLKSGTWGAGFGTSSVAARADGFGNDWVLTITNTGANDDNLSPSSANLNARVAAGDRVFATGVVAVSGLANWKGCSMFVESTSGATTYRAGALERATTDDPAATADKFVQTDHEMTMVTGVLTIPAGFSTLYLRLRPRWAAAGGTAVIKWGRVGLWKLPAA
ncbi:SGNH/GDSL hydrolase family protein [Xanthobacter sp. KR7-65]|uniref:SGNH/GDSL hydrolase family protein n=1 Tax=Xanthobacter sp. KR7-65 TaxID=3156612 RepID=UPI0032B59ED4